MWIKEELKNKKIHETQSCVISLEPVTQEFIQQDVAIQSVYCTYKSETISFYLRSYETFLHLKTKIYQMTWRNIKHTARFYRPFSLFVCGRWESPQNICMYLNNFYQSRFKVWSYILLQYYKNENLTHLFKIPQSLVSAKKFTP